MRTKLSLILLLLAAYGGLYDKAVCEPASRPAAVVQAPAPPEAQPTPAGPRKPDDPAVYLLMMPDGSQGCAAAYSDTLAVTVAHVGRGSGKLFVDGKTLPCVVTPIAGDADIAWVRVPDGGLPTPGTAGVEHYDTVYLFGHRTKKLTPALVSNTKWSRDNSLLLTVPPEFEGVFPGDSGGAVINMKGELVGVISAYSSGEHRSVIASKVPLKKPDVPKAAAGSKPMLWVTSPEWCIYCKPLKRDIASGVFSDFNVEFVEPRNGILKYPAIEYMNADGMRRVQYGYNSSTLEALKQKAH